MSNSEIVRAAEAEILAHFERIDVHGDGRISEAEFVAILTRETSQRTSLSHDKAKQLFAKADLDRAGHVEYKKFAAAWATHYAARTETQPLLTHPEATETQPLLTHPEATGLAARAGTRPPHFGPEALLKSVESGAIAPLRGRWVVDLDANDGRLKRRQDLPPEAFFPADELRRLTEALGDDYGLLFAGLSYRWLSKENPDPDGFHLKIVAKVARLYMHENESKSPLTAAFAAKGLGAPDFALFWDFASLFQKPREEPEQVKLFKEGLKASNVWYGHETTVCWMQTELPPGFRFDEGIAQTYDESGWCFVEAAISAGLKVGKRRLDLAKRTDKAMGGYGGFWAILFPERTLEGVCAVARLPPLLPDEVLRRLKYEKKFTAKTDVGVVDGLYRDFFKGAADSAMQLDFSGLGWGEAEAKQLEVVLPRFTQLKTLDLSSNKLGAAGASAIASLLKTTQISSLNLDGNWIGDEGVSKLAAVLKETKISELNLAGNQLCGLDSRGRGTYTAEGIMKLCEGLKGSSVTSLNLADNQLCGVDEDEDGEYTTEGITALCEGLKGSSVTSLNLSGNHIGPEGGAALAEGLKGNSTLQSLDLAFNKLCGVDRNGNGTYTTEGITKLCEALKGSAVTSLNLSHNGIGDEGVTKLAAILKETKIEKLNLASNNLCPIEVKGRLFKKRRINTTGITALCKGLKGSAVTSLDLQYNNLTDDAKKALRDAAGSDIKIKF